jgi:catechol 2,3-dioxygenase-like lactoylglutathione lyase family enzyme
MSAPELTVDLAAHPSQAKENLKLEVVVVPVADVDRAKAFYADRLGWRTDADVAQGDRFRIVQITPPGSDTSIQFGTNITSAEPGSLRDLYLVASDIEAACAELNARGADVGPIFHEAAPGGRFDRAAADARAAGASPDGTYGTFATFRDPDGNSWLLQEVTTRLPGRIEHATTFASAGELEKALIRAAAAHGEHEQRTGAADPDWPAWYADYMVKEQAGEALPT